MFPLRDTSLTSTLVNIVIIIACFGKDSAWGLTPDSVWMSHHIGMEDQRVRNWATKSTAEQIESFWYNMKHLTKPIIKQNIQKNTQ